MMVTFDLSPTDLKINCDHLWSMGKQCIKFDECRSKNEENRVQNVIFYYGVMFDDVQTKLILVLDHFSDRTSFRTLIYFRHFSWVN